MAEREPIALVVVLVLPVVPLVCAIARMCEVLAGGGMDPTLVPDPWPVPFFNRVGVGAVVAVMCLGPAWRWVQTSPDSAVRALPRLLSGVAAVAFLQALVAP